MATLDASNDLRMPDVAVLAVAKRAEDLAGVVRSLRGPLALAKVTVGDADRLDALAALLRTSEGDWQSARKTMATGTVAKCREPLLAGRNDLYGAIDAFVDDERAAKELEEIGSVDDDDDLEADTSRLVALARNHRSDLEGTEISPAKQERRNRVFWALSALDRTVCKRGRFAFRADPKRRAAFGSYMGEVRRAKKAARATARRSPRPPRARWPPRCATTTAARSPVAGSSRPTSLARAGAAENPLRVRAPGRCGTRR